MVRNPKKRDCHLKVAFRNKTINRLVLSLMQIFIILFCFAKILSCSICLLGGRYEIAVQFELDDL